MAGMDGHTLTTLINLYPLSSYVVIFLISMAESLAVVGLLFPGTVLLIAVGVLVSNGVLAWPLTLVVAIAGAVTGDGLSYWLGYHYQERIRCFWPFSRQPKLLQRGVDFFRCHGGKSVFIGRFVGPMRPIVPLIAGMLNMPAKQFALVNVVSAICWACAYILPGVGLGTSIRLLPAANRWQGLWMIGVLVVGGIVWRKYRIYRWRKRKKLGE